MYIQIDLVFVSSVDFARTLSGRAKLVERLSVQFKHSVIIHVACKEEQTL